MPPRVTISSVAKAAGVSIKSVSRVINREPNVSPKLREKVEGAIATLGYVPDLAARSLAGGRSFTIGLLLNDYGDAFMPSYYPKSQSGAYKACRDNGYHLIVETLPMKAADFRKQMETMLATVRVDGFILPPPFADHLEALDILAEREMPVARIAPSTDLDRTPQVAIDDEAAARDMANHLLSLGHRRIGFVAGRDEHPAAHARRTGFVQAMTKAGCGDFPETPGLFQFDEGIAAAKRLMQSQSPPTAIFAANDDSAAGVMAGLNQLGYKVPDDVSVAGFDDSWIAVSVWPYLTTVHQPIAEMAEVAANMLISRNGGARDNVMLDYHLVVRGSTAPPRSAG